MSGTPTLSKSDTPTDPVTTLRPLGIHIRRSLYFVLVIMSGLGGGRMMYEILQPNGFTPLEALLLILFASTFTWVVSAFWSASIGFILQLFRLDPYSLRRLPGVKSTNRQPHSRTAVVMPVYNEDTARVIAGFETNIRSLAKTGHLDTFDFYLLSDTQDPALAEAEKVAWRHLKKRLGPLARRAYYRRRQQNRNRKVGNIADFCQRWGSLYDHMIVLDADSLMSGDCMVELALRMEAAPHAGLIQTIPVPVRQDTFFGRFIQFAANLYSPLLASGFAFWQVNNCNYWGHNAIIRVSAFMACCGLPSLPGRAPFGGEILSHDFVEAALLYRGGWGVYLAADLAGSFEEVPGNFIDYAKRDRRWAQGNLQHLALLNAPGLSNVSRMHFLFGALAYLSSLSWASMLIFSTVDAVLRATSTEVFFSQTYQLFPNWPTAKTETILSLLYLTVIILFAPKVMGCLTALIHRRRAFGGALPLLVNTAIELIFAILIAPLMMCIHAFFVLCVLLGCDVKWNPQPREGRLVGWREAWRGSYPMVLFAVAWATLTGYFSQLYMYWLSPVLIGMLAAPLLIRYSSKPLGAFSRRFKLLTAPSEQCNTPILLTLNKVMAQLPTHFTGPAPEPALPADQWQTMPIQSLQAEKWIHRLKRSLST